MRPLRAALAGLILSLVVATAASAITVRDIRVDDNGASARFSATLVSPPTARNCTAQVSAGIFAANPLRLIKKLANYKINVCQTGRRGTTYGYLTGRFSMFNIRTGNYALCLRARQVLRSGRTSAHTECKIFQHFE